MPKWQEPPAPAELTAIRKLLSGERVAEACALGFSALRSKRSTLLGQHVVLHFRSDADADAFSRAMIAARGGTVPPGEMEPI